MTANELLKKFEGNKTHERFIRDMRKLGVTMAVYSPRGGYGIEIPAAYTDDEHTLQDVIRATKLTVKYDTLGKRWVVYP